MNIYEVIKSETTGVLNNTAIVEAKRSLNYAQLFLLVEKLAHKLEVAGVKKYQRIALHCKDSIEYIILNLAILKLNAVVVPVPYGASAHETKEVIKKIKADFFIDWDKKEVGDLKNTQIPPLEYANLNPAFIRFSSGTTGAAKGVLLSHEAIIERTALANQALQINCADTVVWLLQMSFHFVVTILLFLRCGAKIVLCGNDFPAGLAEGLKVHKVTFLYASPFHYNLMAASPLIEAAWLLRVRLAISTAAKLAVLESENFFKKFNFELNEAYGIIEVGLPFVNTSGDKNKRGSVGKLLPGYEIKLVDCDAQGVGKILLKGKGMFNSYLSPWALRDAVTKDGWFDTGDLGYLDGDGFLFIVGREKNLINFNGMKIFPAEVEAVINSYPEVKESRVYAKAHPVHGEIPAAQIVLKDGQNNLQLDDLRRFIYKNIDKYKAPKEFEIVTEIPKTLSGKIKIIDK